VFVKQIIRCGDAASGRVDENGMDRVTGPEAAADVRHARFQTLSHAGLRVNAGGRELLCDPWVIGSCYWRSWWNYPPVPRPLVDSLKPDFIYLTHLHWDHFQAPSLRLFPADTQVLVPYDRYERMVRDLHSIGMRNVREVRHGERVQLAPGLAIRSYHFSPFVTDSAVVIEAGDTVLVNANDAKLAGRPLRQLLADYPRVDFCFRSHSSANPRACFHVTDQPDVEVDDNEHYLRAFSLFIEKVKPRYAIPFASNSCLLHDDVYHLNPLVQTPLIVKEYFEAHAATRGLQTRLQIMVPGDCWDSRTGFHIQEQDWFTRREEHLEAYRARVQPTLERQRKIEARVKVPLSLVEKYFGALKRDTPSYLLGPLKGEEVLLVAQSERETGRFAVDLAGGKVRIPEPDETFDMRIEFPALILLHSMKLNMFGHAGISKRVNFYATAAKMPKLQRFNSILEWREAELLPLRANFTRRSARALMRRWREGLLYAKVLVELRRGYDLPTIEERQLEAA
jgi:UDP-MurNAc hydroxylase